jgi:uracil-DNA glycosylase
LLELFDYLPGDWQKSLVQQRSNVDRISKHLESIDSIPEKRSIFAAFPDRPEDVRVLILGQDPYPDRNHATGLACSIPGTIKALPASLRNIFTELESDLGIINTSGDLSSWKNQGVLLFNRVLTTTHGSSLAHQGIGWEEFTGEVIRIASLHNPIAVLWGKKAGECAQYFAQDLTISSPHPSPLSAYRGFFGSKPFSRVNSLLLENGSEAIDWSTRSSTK